MSGPFDTHEKSRKILKQLGKTSGQGEFHDRVGLDSVDENEEKETEFKA